MSVALKISVNDVAAMQTLNALQAKTSNQTAFSRIAGEVMRESIERTFAAEGSPGGSWRKLHASSLGVQYANTGAKKGKKVFRQDGLNTAGFLRFARGKKILQNTGRLKNSITYRPASGVGGTAQLVIGTNLLYARIHQFGGTIRAKSARALKFLVSTPTGLQFVQKRAVKIPARPYLVIRPEDPKRLTQAIEDFLKA